MKEDKVDYNAWHQNHEIEDDITASWHLFAIDCIKKVNVAGATVLEIGCGRGGFSDYVIKNYPNVSKLYACDYSESAVKIGEQKYGNAGGKISWQKEDIQNMTFASNAIDIAVSCETIEHIPSSAKGIKELARVVKPGGYLILTCPNYFNLFGIWCLYRLLIGKPYTEGGQPFVRYILQPFIYWQLRKNGFRTVHYHSAELIIPVRKPIHFFDKKLPKLLQIFGYRTYYLLQKV